MNKLCYTAILLSCIVSFSGFIGATKDQEDTSQSLLTQLKEYFYPKDAPAPASLKKFMSEQAKICGMDPESIDVRICSDAFWQCRVRSYPNFMELGNKSRIEVNPLLVPVINISSFMKNISSAAESVYGVNVMCARHELGHAQQDSKLKDSVCIGSQILVLASLYAKALSKCVPKGAKVAGLVPAAATAAAVVCERHIGMPLYYKYREALADNFAIAHTSEKNYLLAAAKALEFCHTEKLAHLKQEAQSSVTKQALLKAIERYPSLIELCYYDDLHPSDISRAKKFYAAAQAQETVQE